MPPTPFPDAFIERMRALGDAIDAPDLLERLGEPTRPSFRVRGTTGLDDELAALEPVAVPGLGGTWSVAPTRRDALTRSHAAETGAIYIQNPSSQRAALAVPIESADPDSDLAPSILDLAAAPGGKTIVLADRLRDAGLDLSALRAVEVVPARFHRLRANLERCGHVDTAATARCTDGRRLPRDDRGTYDAVLLDAPCSSESRFSPSRPESFAKWSLGKVRDLARKQWGLLGSALGALAPGGTCIYATCSFAPEENEAQVAAWLGSLGEGIEVCRLPEHLLEGTQWRPGLTQWGKKRWPDDTQRCTRILPDGLHEGFFVACLRNVSGATLDIRTRAR